MIDNILRHESIFKTIVKGEFKGHNGWERPKAEYMTQIIKDMYKGKYKDLKNWVTIEKHG